jgi:hypothetical protein
MNWFKRLFCKEEVRRIKSLDSNQVLAQILSKCIRDEKIKCYSNLSKFIETYSKEDLDRKYLKLKYVIVTPEIEKLKKNWKILSYKCTDTDLDSFMRS